MSTRHQDSGLCLPPSIWSNTSGLNYLDLICGKRAHATSPADKAGEILQKGLKGPALLLVDILDAHRFLLAELAPLFPENLEQAVFDWSRSLLLGPIPFKKTGVQKVEYRRSLPPGKKE